MALPIIAIGSEMLGRPASTRIAQVTAALESFAVPVVRRASSATAVDLVDEIRFALPRRRPHRHRRPGRPRTI